HVTALFVEHDPRPVRHAAAILVRAVVDQAVGRSAAWCHEPSPPAVGATAQAPAARILAGATVTAHPEERGVSPERQIFHPRHVPPCCDVATHEDGLTHQGRGGGRVPGTAVLERGGHPVSHERRLGIRQLRPRYHHDTAAIPKRTTRPHDGTNYRVAAPSI